MSSFKNIGPLFWKVTMNEKFALRVIKNPRLAKISTKDRETLAHRAVRYHKSAAIEAVKNYEIAKLKSTSYFHGRTVAHIAVNCFVEAAEKSFENLEIIQIADDTGWTVGNEALRFHNRAILTLIEEARKFYNKLLREDRKYKKEMNLIKEMGNIKKK